MLTDRITLVSAADPSFSVSLPDVEPEDILASSLGVIFPDDITNQHGDASSAVIYSSPLPAIGRLALRLAAPFDEPDRRLFSHYVWNASIQLAALIEDSLRLDAPTSRRCRTRGSSVLELGAGSGLAGLVAARAGAARVVLSDYPAPVVLANLRANVRLNLGSRSPCRCRVVAHAWGDLPAADAERADIAGDEIAGEEDEMTEEDEDAGLHSFARTHRASFSQILVADCLWMPWQHANLRRSIAWFLSREAGSRAWIVAGFHTGRAKVRQFFFENEKEGGDDDGGPPRRSSLAALGLEIEDIWEVDAAGAERTWVPDRGGAEDVTTRKRWLVVAVLKWVEG